MSDSTSIINRLSLLLKERKNSPNSNSYTSQLFTEGVEKIIAKIREESEELIESAETDVVNKDSIIHEAADLLFHVMVLLAYKDCLLYTSPSPRDQLGSRMPSSA